MLEHAVAAVELLDPDTDRSVRADHLIGLADALGASGSYDDSIRRYQEGAQLATACGDRYLQLAVLNNLAYTQYEAGLAGAAVATVEQMQTDYAAEGLALRTHEATRSRAPTAWSAGSRRPRRSSSR